MSPIETRRLRLDAVTEADADAVFDLCQDAELQRYVPVPVPYTREVAASYVGDYAPKASALWAIREDGAFLGVVELHLEPAGSAELGYWLGAPYRGRGIMTEAVGAVLAHGFGTLDLERIWWCAIVGNTASAVVAQRTGFRFEGVRRKAADHRGTREDAWFGCLLREGNREPQDGWPA